MDRHYRELAVYLLGCLGLVVGAGIALSIVVWLVITAVRLAT